MTIYASPGYFQEAREVKAALLQSMFGVASVSAAKKPQVAALSTPKLPVSNILGVGYGVKVTSGGGIDVLAARVYVRAKLPGRALRDGERVPEYIDGIPTDIIPVGSIAAQFPRPVPCGVSCGHVDITMGTLGCLVTSNGSNRFILSNNHVLANVNQAQLGTDILEPGPADGGSGNPPIARLTAYQPIAFNGIPNQIDAALAELTDLANVIPEIDTIGLVTAPPMNAALLQSVRKHGSATRQTLGVVMDLAADVLVTYGSDVAQFGDQIAVAGVNGAFSAPGDSGSLVIDATTTSPVGLLFAGGEGLTFCNHIPNVLDTFGVSIV